MELEIEVKIVHIVCVKSNEEVDDVYCTVKGKYLGTDSRIERKFPEKGTWKLGTGQSTGPNETLFTGPIDKGIELEIKFHEQDAGGLISFSDDGLGGTNFTFGTDKTYKWDDHKKSTYEGKQTDGSHQYFLEGSRAEYRIRFAVYEKVAI